MSAQRKRPLQTTDDVVAFLMEGGKLQELVERSIADGTNYLAMSNADGDNVFHILCKFEFGKKWSKDKSKELEDYFSKIHKFTLKIQKLFRDSLGRPNRQGYTPLMLAIENNHRDTAGYLLMSDFSNPRYFNDDNISASSILDRMQQQNPNISFAGLRWLLERHMEIDSIAAEEIDHEIIVEPVDNHDGITKDITIIFHPPKSSHRQAKAGNTLDLEIFLLRQPRGSFRLTIKNMRDENPFYFLRSAGKNTEIKFENLQIDPLKIKHWQTYNANLRNEILLHNQTDEHDELLEMAHPSNYLPYLGVKDPENSESDEDDIDDLMDAMTRQNNDHFFGEYQTFHRNLPPHRKAAHIKNGQPLAAAERGSPPPPLLPPPTPLNRPKRRTPAPARTFASVETQTSPSSPPAVATASAASETAFAANAHPERQDSIRARLRAHVESKRAASAANPPPPPDSAQQERKDNIRAELRARVASKRAARRDLEETKGGKTRSCRRKRASRTIARRNKTRCSNQTRLPNKPNTTRLPGRRAVGIHQSLAFS